MEASEVEATDVVDWGYSGQNAFYYHVYTDADHIIRPWLKPRGERVGGPYRSYEIAEREAQKQPHTHFSISKMTVRAGIQIPFKEESSG